MLQDHELMRAWTNGGKVARGDVCDAARTDWMRNIDPPDGGSSLGAAPGNQGMPSEPTPREGDSGDPESEDDTELTSRTHLDEDIFIGVVTGYENPDGAYGFGCDDQNCVVVDNAAVNLALITTWEVSCIDANGVDRAEALRIKEKLLPVGTTVQVIRSAGSEVDRFDLDGFIHKFDPIESSVSLTSVNEELVTSGYWVPDTPWSNSHSIGNAYSDVRIYTANSGALFTEVEARYAPRLIESANAARYVGNGGQADCLQQLVDRAEQEAAWAVAYEESKRQGDAWYQDWLKSNPGGLIGCRDGDGDGVCFER